MARFMSILAALILLCCAGCEGGKLQVGTPAREDEEVLEEIKPPAGKYDFYVGGRLLFNKKVYVKDGASMLPVKKIAEKLGYTYDYGVISRVATLTQGVHQFKLEMDLNQYNVAKSSLQLETAPKIYDATVYAPVSFFTQCMGVEVEVEGSSITVG